MSMPPLKASLAALLCFALAGQERSPQEQTLKDQPMALDSPPIRQTVNVVVAPATVTDRRGNHVHGILPHEFKLFDNNKLQDIRVDVSFTPISLAVLVQADAAAEPVLPKIQKLGSVIQGLVIGEQGEAAIVKFDHRIEMLQDFTSDVQKISDAFQKLKPGSSSSRLNDAVVQGIRLLRNKPRDRRRVVLIISETRDKGSESDLRDTLDEAQVHNITVYTVNISRLVTAIAGKTPVPAPDPIPTSARRLPPGAPQTPTSVAAYTGTGSIIPLVVEVFRGVKGVFVDNPAELLTKYTGGQEFSFKSQTELEEALRKVGYDLHSQYLLAYNPNNKIEGGWHDIRVEVARPDLRVRTRLGYWLAGIPEGH